MPKLCEPCRTHVADAAPACPDCGGPVKFTLLPAPGAAAAPLDLRTRPAPRPAALSDLWRGRNPLYAALALLGVVLAGAVLWYAQSQSFDARAARLKPGMRVEAAMRAMGDSNTGRGRYRVQLGDPGHGVPDFDRPVDVSGAGTLVYEGGGKSVHIAYANGVVTSVEHGEACGGLRRRVTVGR